jgi:hypothetical protein
MKKSYVRFSATVAMIASGMIAAASCKSTNSSTESAELMSSQGNAKIKAGTVQALVLKTLKDMNRDGIVNCIRYQGTPVCQLNSTEGFVIQCTDLSSDLDLCTFSSPRKGDVDGMFIHGAPLNWGFNSYLARNLDKMLDKGDPALQSIPYRQYRMTVVKDKNALLICLRDNSRAERACAIGKATISQDALAESAAAAFGG